jgi:hypothetical protein
MEKSEDFPKLFGISFFIGMICLAAYSELFPSSSSPVPAAPTTPASTPANASEKPAAPVLDELEPEPNEPDPSEYREWVEKTIRESGPPFQWTAQVTELTDRLVAISGLPEATVKQTPLNKMIDMVRKAKPSRGYTQKQHDQYVARLEQEYGRFLFSLNDFHKIMCIRKAFHEGKHIPDSDIKFMRNMYRKFELSNEVN